MWTRWSIQVLTTDICTAKNYTTFPTWNSKNLPTCAKSSVRPRPTNRPRTSPSTIKNSTARTSRKNGRNTSEKLARTSRPNKRDNCSNCNKNAVSATLQYRYCAEYQSVCRYCYLAQSWKTKMKTSRSTVLWNLWTTIRGRSLCRLELPKTNSPSTRNTTTKTSFPPPANKSVNSPSPPTVCPFCSA